MCFELGLGLAERLQLGLRYHMHLEPARWRVLVSRVFRRLALVLTELQYNQGLLGLGNSRQGSVICAPSVLYPGKALR